MSEFYYCKVLSGEDCYNLCVNCDLTVSCNCSDNVGSGILGDLNSSSFEELWRSENGTANRFRRSLAAGVQPIINCKYCSSLCKVDENTAKEKLLKIDFPKGMMIENGPPCNFKCTFCSRYDLPKFRKKTKMGMEDLERVMKIAQSMGLKYLFYFNLNEPFLSSTILEEMLIIRKYLPTVRIVTSTNGSAINTDRTREAALLMDEVIFSIDGATQESVAIYQVKMEFQNVVRNLRDLIEVKKRTGAKTIISWKYVVFTWNESEQEIKQAIEMAKNVGCNDIRFCRGFTHERPVSHFEEQEFFKQLNSTRRLEYYIINFI